MLRELYYITCSGLFLYNYRDKPIMHMWKGLCPYKSKSDSRKVKGQLSMCLIECGAYGRQGPPGVVARRRMPSGSLGEGVSRKQHINKSV
jgi:hypothetical protein